MDKSLPSFLQKNHKLKIMLIIKAQANKKMVRLTFLLPLISAVTHITQEKANCLVKSDKKMVGKKIKIIHRWFEKLTLIVVVAVRKVQPEKSGGP